MHRPELFNSFFMGGFECSTHRRHDGRRLDLIESTGHGKFFAEDFSTMAGHGLRTVRDGLRWHLIEPTPGQFDWSSFLPMLHASRAAGVQPIWPSIWGSMALSSSTNSARSVPDWAA